MLRYIQLEDGIASVQVKKNKIIRRKEITPCRRLTAPLRVTLTVWKGKTVVAAFVLLLTES